MMHIIMPGLQTLVQDSGRDGYYALGMPPAGALDQRSYTLGNMLVGNDSRAAGLEFAFMGPAIQFQSDTVIAVTGAEVTALIDGEPQPMWASVPVKNGQTLSFGPMTRGSRGYIAVRGGVDVPKLLGSRSTYQTVQFGGHMGRALKPGDVLPIGTQIHSEDSHGDRIRELDPKYLPSLDASADLAVVTGLANYRFTPESVQLFFEANFTVSHEANRTAYRLIGPALEFVERDVPFGAGSDPSNVVNLGYPLGSIQIPSGNEPICLLRDAVTGGGYVTFGTIISTDLDALAQLKTPDTVTFTSVSVTEAHAKRRYAQNELAQIAKSLEYPWVFGAEREETP